MRCGLIGYGYWGQKIARVLNQLGVLRAICDKNCFNLLDGYEKVSCLYGYENLLAESDAVVIATPPETHYEIAKVALEAGKHVFVEKPLATDYKQAKELEELAKEKGLRLRVGHIYLHCPGLLAIPKFIGEAELWVKLLNIAGAPSETTREIIWAGLPHAVSIALHFFGDKPDDIRIMKKDEHRVRLDLAWDDHSRAYLDVGDYTGRRMRDVELRVGNTRWNFNADKPYIQRMTVSEGEIRLWCSPDLQKTIASVSESSDPDPLTLELKAFLEKDGVDTMGSKVVKLIERIVCESKS